MSQRIASSQSAPQKESKYVEVNGMKRATVASTYQTKQRKIYVIEIAFWIFTVAQLIFHVSEFLRWDTVVLIAIAFSCLTLLHRGYQSGFGWSPVGAVAMWLCFLPIVGW